MPTAANSAEIQFRCTIKYMFKGCPKQDGWFGCFATMKGGIDIKLTGKIPVPITKGMQLEVTAVKKGDDEFEAHDITIITKTLTGTKAYLMSLNGISEPVAKKIVQIFGSDAIEISRTDPDTVKTRANLTDKQMKALTEGIANTEETNQIRKFLPELSTDAVNYLKKNVPHPQQAIQKNPWMLLQCPHTSFTVVDTIAIRLGTSPFDKDRIEKGILHVLEFIQNGDNYINLSDDNAMLMLMSKTEELLRIRFGKGMQEFGKRLMDMAAEPDPQIFIRKYKNEYHLYMIADWRDYTSVIDHVMSLKSRTYLKTAEEAKKLKQMVSVYGDTDTMSLVNEQRYGIIMALSVWISIITGGPGRGKTMTISRLAECNLHMNEVVSNQQTNKPMTVLLAPTGRAAKKLNEATAGAYAAMTIDKLICIAENEAQHVHGHKSSYKCAKINNDATLIIVDESSMADMPKIAALMTYFDKVRYCFVGDKDQLPPVGVGQFFHDLIASKAIAVAELKKPLRNNGIILQNSDKINNGDTSLTYDVHEMPLFPQADDNQAMLDFIISQYNDEMLIEPDPQQIALICPVKKGPVGVININMEMQNIVCPENQYGIAAYNALRGRNIFSAKGYPIPGTFYGNGQNYTHFRVGDTIMCTKSDYHIELTGYSHDDFWNGTPTDQSIGIFNGDIGRIIGYQTAHSVGNDTDSDFIIVQFNDGKVAELDRSNSEFDHFTLCYAMTVHKAQGCEYNTVIYISPKSLSGMVSTGFACRNLVYTAITRAKRRTVIIGNKDSLNACIATEMLKRNSTLAEEIS